MQLKDFIKLNKNYGEMNHGQDLTDEFLIDIYKSIASEQIFTSSIVSERFPPHPQATNDQLRNEQWVNVIRQSHIPEKQQFIAHSSEFFEHCAHCSAGMYDRDIFSIVWSSSLAAAGALLEVTEDHRLMEFSLDVFVTLARISAFFNLSVSSFPLFQCRTLSTRSCTSSPSSPASRRSTSIRRAPTIPSSSSCASAKTLLRKPRS